MNTLRALHWAPAVLCLTPLLAGVAHADFNSKTAPHSHPRAAVSASARLDFAVTLGSFLSLQVGSPGATIDTVGFDLASLASPTCTATPLPICFGNGRPVDASTNRSLGVTVKSNAGPVNLKAKVVSALTSGTNTIPMSQIVLVSDTTNLPAPTLPDTDTGTAVNIAPTAFGGRVTHRSANWKFSFANTVATTAGSYTGQVMFIATAP